MLTKSHWRWLLADERQRYDDKMPWTVCTYIRTVIVHCFNSISNARLQYQSIVSSWVVHLQFFNALFALLRNCLSPYLQTKTVSVYILRKYAMNTIKCSPLLHANTMLIILFLSYHTPMFPWKNTAVFQYLPICCWHWKRSVLNTHRIRKYAYLFACSKSSVFEAYQCERKAETDRFCSVFIQ